MRAAHPKFARLSDGDFFAVRIAQFDFGGGNGQSDAAAVRFDIERVAAHAGTGFGQTVSFDDGRTGNFFPFFGDGFLSRHASAQSQAKVGEIDGSEIGLVDHAVKQGVHADEDADALFFEFADKAFHVTRVGNQDDFGTGVGKNHQVHRQSEDVVKRQRGDDGFFAFAQLVFNPFFRLKHIGADVAVAEDGAFGDAGRAARVLQQRGIFAGQGNGAKGMRRPFFQGRLKRDSAGNAVFGHHFFDFAQHEIHQRAFEEAEHFSDRSDDDVFDLRARQHQLQRVGKIFQNDDGGRAAVFQLMLQLARGVERIGVHRHQPRLQDAKKCNRVLQQVGQHNRHALAALQLQNVLQIGSEIFRQLADFGVSERFAHVLKRGLMREFFNALTEYVADRAVLRDVDFGIDTLFVAVEPEFFHINNLVSLVLWLS